MVPDNTGQSATSPSDDVSLLRVGSTLLVHRRLVILLALIGAFGGGLSGLLRERRWTSNSSFVPTSGADENQLSGLRNLAGQFGVAVPGGSSSSPLSSPAFLAEVGVSRRVLEPILRDTVTVAELGGAKRAVIDLTETQGVSEGRRLQLALRELSNEWVKISPPRAIGGGGSIKLAVSTPWPSVSQAVALRVIDGLNRLNYEATKLQASQERQLVERLIVGQRGAVREAEEKVIAFRRANRLYEGSPDLAFESEKLQADVTLQQQILTSLAQRLEDARIRELRDLPLLLVIETPDLPAIPEARGTVKRTIFGGLGGLFVGVLLAIIREITIVRRRAGDPELERFVGLLNGLRPLRRSAAS